MDFTGAGQPKSGGQGRLLTAVLGDLPPRAQLAQTNTTSGGFAGVGSAFAAGAVFDCVSTMFSHAKGPLDTPNVPEDRQKTTKMYDKFQRITTYIRQKHPQKLLLRIPTLYLHMIYKCY